MQPQKSYIIDTITGELLGRTKDQIIKPFKGIFKDWIENSNHGEIMEKSFDFFKKHPFMKDQVKKNCKKLAGDINKQIIKNMMHDVFVKDNNERPIFQDNLFAPVLSVLNWVNKCFNENIVDLSPLEKEIFDFQPKNDMENIMSALENRQREIPKDLIKKLGKNLSSKMEGRI